jgi:drug/metabolite transporter (DMT)-like permease
LTPKPFPRPARWSPDAALAANTLIWGATFVMVKDALADVSPLVFLALRFSIATLALIIFFFPPWRKARVAPRPAPLASGSQFLPGLLIGCFLFLGYLFQTVGLQFTSAPKSAFLTGLASVMVPFVAALVYRSRPRLSELLGLLVATAGMGLMTLEGPFGSINRGDVLTFCCAITFAAHIVTLGHFSEKLQFEWLSIMQAATAAALALSLCWWVERPRFVGRPGSVGAILVTGLLATALAFSIQAWAQQYVSPSRTALIYMLEPVIAWLTSYLMVGEGLSTRAAAGAALILSGVTLVEMKPLDPRQHPH